MILLKANLGNSVPPKLIHRNPSSSRRRRHSSIITLKFINPRMKLKNQIRSLVKNNKHRLSIHGKSNNTRINLKI
ncbi:hypothetical protein HanPSC8_Chr05g0203831 [Helianthus annuus]|nr:hypothetical protein HanPSC8_Chr05g0203831 [Helianthus annuus]